MGEPDKIAKPTPTRGAGPPDLGPGLGAAPGIGAGNALAATGSMAWLAPTVDHPHIELDRARPGLFSYTGPWTLDAVKTELYGDLALLAPPLEPANLPQVGWQRELAFVPMFLREPYRSQYFQLLAAAKPATPPVVVPPDLEAALIGELEARVTGAASVARRQRLLAMSRAVASPYREVLLDRLAHPLHGDWLAGLFVQQLAPPTQAAILAALRGEVIALSVDESEVSQFVAALRDDCLRVEPDPAVIGPWMEQVDVVVAPRCEQAMPVVAHPLELRWTLIDAEETVLESATSRWLPGLDEGEGFTRSFTTAGKFSVKLSVLDAGMVRASLATSITVQAFDGGAEVKPGMVPPGATAAAEAMSDRQVQDELRATQQQLAAMSPVGGAVSDEHALLVAAETALEGAAASRELARAPLVPKDEKRSVYLGAAMEEQVGGLGDLGTSNMVTPDPVYARIQLEQVTAARGWAMAKGLVDYIEYAGQGDPFGSKEIGDLLREMLPIYRAQLAILELERARLIDDFTARAKELTFEVLKQSENRAGDAMLRYGIEVEGMVLDEHGKAIEITATPGDPVGRPTMRKSEFTVQLSRAALELADAQRAIHTLTRTAAEQKLAAEAALPVPQGGGGESREMADFATTPELQQYQETAAALLEAQEDYEHLRAANEAAYPILALAKNAKGDDLDLAKLDHLASNQTDEMAKIIAGKVIAVLRNTEHVRSKLSSGDLNIWRESEIVQMTKLKMQLAAGSMRAKWIDEQVEEEEPGFLSKYGLTILGALLSLVAAIPTGGASLVVGTAGIAALGIDTYLALQAIDEYRMKSAMAGSDYDKARALSKDEPSLFWLAVQIVGTIVGAGAGVKSATQLTKAFQKIVQARRAVLALRELASAEEVVERVAVLRAAARDAELGEQATERLVRETAEEIPHDVAEAAGLGTRAEATGAEAAHEVQTLADRGNVAVRAGDDAEVARVAAPRRPAPVGQQRASLLAKRGSDAEVLAEHPAGWTGAKEAEWRGYPDPPEGHEWYWKGDDIALRLEAGGREANLTRYHYDGIGFVEVESDAVTRARYHSRETWEMPPADRERLGRFARSRQRSQAMKTVLEDGEDLTKAAMRMTRASESLGEEAAANWVRATYPEAVPLHGWPPNGLPGAQYEFDQIWKIPGGGPNGADMFVVIEAKGATAGLGTRTIGKAIVEQGTAQYYGATLRAMKQAGKAGARELELAMPGAVRYVKVKAPVSEAFGRHTVRDLVISDFDVP